MKNSGKTLACAVALATSATSTGASAQSYCKQIASDKETPRKILYPFGVATSANEYM
jgi:hypothetical protein